MSDIASSIDDLSQNNFRIGQVLARSFRVYFSCFLSFTLIGTIANIPTILIILYIPAITPEAQAMQSLFLMGFSMVIGPLVTATILYGAFQQMRGLPFRLGESVARGMSRMLPLFVLTILFGLGVGLGALLLFIPGLILMVMWYVAVPCCVIERTGPVRSFGRSRELTKGSRWKLFGLILLTIIISLVFATVVGALFGIIGGLTDFVDLVQQQKEATWPLLTFQLVISGIQQAFFSVLVVVTYYHLRLHKEGADIDSIASVFD
jgi:uncharacterized membrane protein